MTCPQLPVTGRHSGCILKPCSAECKVACLSRAQEKLTGWSCALIIWRRSCILSRVGHSGKKGLCLVQSGLGLGVAVGHQLKGPLCKHLHQTLRPYLKTCFHCSAMTRDSSQHLTYSEPFLSELCYTAQTSCSPFCFCSITHSCNCQASINSKPTQQRGSKSPCWQASRTAAALLTVAGLREEHGHSKTSQKGLPEQLY